ncbi:MAG TPA: sulfotransferase [bacterium]
MTAVATATRPDFFIVGAPKCGTTSLYRWLSEHPDVYMSPRKEPHYFCPDLYSPRYVHDEPAYLALFSKAAGQSRAGEASVYYLYSREAARRIHAFDPQARIIMMLRRPVEMIHSLHSQRLFSGHEEIEDFEEALTAEPARKRGFNLPPNPYPIPCLFYREVGRYAAQVARYLDVFPRSRVHVIIFDDFVRDPAATFGDVCRFLGVDPEFRPDFAPANTNTTIRSPRLRDWMKFSPATRALARAVMPRPLRRGLAERLHQLNRRATPRPPMSAALRRGLQAEFAADVAALGALLDRDLSRWNRDPEG